MFLQKQTIAPLDSRTKCGNQLSALCIQIKRFLFVVQSNCYDNFKMLHKAHNINNDLKMIDVKIIKNSAEHHNWI